MPRVYLTEKAKEEAARAKRAEVLSRRLRVARAESKMTQEKFSQTYDVALFVIKKVEAGGHYNITLDSLFKLVQSTKMTPEEWLAFGGFKT